MGCPELQIEQELLTGLVKMERRASIVGVLDMLLQLWWLLFLGCPLAGQLSLCQQSGQLAALSLAVWECYAWNAEPNESHLSLQRKPVEGAASLASACTSQKHLSLDRASACWQLQGQKISACAWSERPGCHVDAWLLGIQSCSLAGQHSSSHVASCCDRKTGTCQGCHNAATCLYIVVIHAAAYETAMTCIATCYFPID